MKRVLVVGASGYVGKYIVKEFKQRGYWIRALARNPEKLKQEGPFLEPAVMEYIDELFVGDLTRPESLRDICRDIDVIFSSMRIIRPKKENLSFRDVDYQENKNLLVIAEKSSVKKFIFISIFQAYKYEYLPLIKAKEDFVRDLKKSKLEYVVIRPTIFFSDMSEFLKMARAGRCYIIGRGENKMNPIHGADVAQVCVDAVELSKTEIEIGGPEIYSYREIAELAFSVIGRRPKIIYIPSYLLNIILPIMRIFSKHSVEQVKFLATAMQNDLIAPPVGQYRLKDYYEELLKYNKLVDV